MFRSGCNEVDEAKVFGAFYCVGVVGCCVADVSVSDKIGERIPDGVCMKRGNTNHYLIIMFAVRYHIENTRISLI